MTSDDLAWREREYSPSSAIGGDYRPFIEQYRTPSAEAHAAIPVQRDLPYGEGPRQRLDYFAAPLSVERPGLLVFIHGGYWQELSKDDSAFLAPAWHEAGFAHAVIGYTLAPTARIGQIVDECRAALRWLIDRADELGFDRDAIVVAGSSAGAYLAAACASDGAGAVLLSGIYDVRPLIGTSIDAALGLDDDEAAALDLFPRPPQCRTVVAWGEVETDEFKRQSRTFAQSIRQASAECVELEVPGRNHFDVVHELGDPDTALFRQVLDLFHNPTTRPARSDRHGPRPPDLPGTRRPRTRAVLQRSSRHRSHQR